MLLKTHFRKVILALIVGTIIVGCSKGEVGSETDSAERLSIAVIPKGTAHEFWKSVHAGAMKAGKDSNVEVIWVGPENEGDRRQQIDIVNNFISREVDAIVLAPLDAVALTRPVEQATNRGIPVIVIDSGLESDKYVSFVATDNIAGGRMGARRLGEQMQGKGKAILLRYAEGSASTSNREEGFLEEMRSSFPDIELISTDQYAGVTMESAMQASQNLLNKYGDVDGVFCPNESSTFGMLRALEISGKAGDIVFVGFDTSDKLLQGIDDGHVSGLVSQDPFDMGFQGVMTAVAVLKGLEVEKRIPTRLEIITPENINDDSIQDLIHPDLEK